MKENLIRLFENQMVSYQNLQWEKETHTVILTIKYV